MHQAYLTAYKIIFHMISKDRILHLSDNKFNQILCSEEEYLV